MLVLKAVHEARLQAKDAEIARLTDEVTWLRQFIQPSRTVPHTVPYEADLVLEGRQDAIDAPEEPAAPKLTDHEIAVLRERDRILSGEY